jgi:cell division protein FtsB
MRFFAAVLFVVLLGLQYRLWISDDGLRSVLNLKKSVAAQRVENAILVQRNGQLAAEVKDFKGGTAALEDETFFQVVDPASRPAAPEAVTPAPGALAAQKTAR